MGRRKIILFFLGVFVATLGLSIAAINHSAEYFHLIKSTHSIDDAYLNSLKKTDYFDSNVLIELKSAQEAKKKQIFWASNAEGRGIGIDILNHAKEFDALFPGYGDELRNDKVFWIDYFKNEFEPNSYLASAPEFSELGFLVAYSWTGCFDIYTKHGADVIVLGSSEVYKTVPPKLLADGLVSAFLNKPKILYCVTSAMPVDAVLRSAEELLAISKNRPTAVIWGYSFWLANVESNKILEYKNIKKIEIESYRSRIETKSNLNASWLIQAKHILNDGMKEYFQSINWGSIMDTSFNRMRKMLVASRNPEQEGMEITQEVISKSDTYLNNFLNENLTPYYSLSVGATLKACSMDEARTELNTVLRTLKLLTKNVFLYIPPTSDHHRRTVPFCFLPALNNMLRDEAKVSNVLYLDSDIVNYGLTNRDFIYPMPSVGRFYFDINHANFMGAEKTAKPLITWVLSELKNR
jgi:hypothetical protein